MDNLDINQAIHELTRGEKGLSEFGYIFHNIEEDLPHMKDVAEEAMVKLNEFRDQLELVVDFLGEELNERINRAPNEDKEYDEMTDGERRQYD